jgi:hypothetical protein
MTTLLKIDIKKGNGVLFDNKNNLIKKFYLTKKKNNNKKLVNELYAYRWYLQKLNKKFTVKKEFNSLIMPVFKGKNLNFWNKNIHRTDLIERVIEHYKSLWPQKKYAPYHGDLTIENVIFLKKNKVVFIDWENYRSKEEWGLDICYFLISLIVLPVLGFKKKSINQTDLNLFKIYWKKTFNKKNYKYLKNPVTYIKKKCTSKNHFFFKITKKLNSQINKSIL